MQTTMSTEPMRTTFMDRSFSVRMGWERSTAPGRMVLMPSVSALQIVGRVLSSVISPAAATAPAPIGLM